MTWHQARETAYAAASPLAAEKIPLAAVLGCILADDLTARSDLPSADTSAMDGWAVCGPPPWVVVGRSLAGHPAGPLAPSEAVVISTGAAVPAGATGILRSECGFRSGDQVDVLSGAPPVGLADRRSRGHEAQKGDVLLAAGAVVTPTVLGLAAAAGYDDLFVHPRPRVSVLTLGDELLDSGPALAGAVRDALGVQIPSWVQALGGTTIDGRRGPDSLPETLAAVGVASGEVVVTTGGSAHGAADHVRPALAALGARLRVDTVDVRPGHPMLLAELPDGRWVVGLPGNPLAALVGVVTLLAPLLAGLRGAPRPPIGSASVEADVVIRSDKRPRDRVAIPVVRTAVGAVRPTGYGASAMLRGVALADGFLLAPATGLRAGDPGEVVWFPWTAP